MPEIRLWLDIHRGQQFGPSAGLYTKAWVGCPYPPDRGDQITLWPGGDEGASDQWEGPNWYVKRRSWGADGSIGLELTTMIIDPDEMTQAAFSIREFYNGFWWTDRDGDPLPGLIRGGWARYGE